MSSSVAELVPPAVSPTNVVSPRGEVPLQNAVGPLGFAGSTDVLRVTLTKYPAKLPMVTVEVVFCPARTVAEVGLAVMVKGTTCASTVIGRDTEPLVPLTVTV